ncbi:MAG: DUF29 domain-containing protein [Caulobacterales bacterium]|jgi:hypothetical protein|nr:DUF29 domain-containing protein [Caulobacterales bacterium]
MSNLYETDAYTWAMRQADALRRRSANEIDWDNVAEEIESVGESEARELESRYAVLLAHLLKWRFQPDARSRSWEATIKVQRRVIEREHGKNPGLKPMREGLFADAYVQALGAAVQETGLGLEVFPEANPFTLAEVVDESFWPEPPAGT